MKYNEVLGLSKTILKQDLSFNDSEAEDIVIAAYTKITSKPWTRFDLWNSAQKEIVPEVLDLVTRYSEQRSQGIPLQYISGIQTFLDHNYHVNPGVFIPRPETECLCMAALSCLTTESIGIEIGVGSGILSIELLSRLGQLKMFGSELNYIAQIAARNNAKRLIANPTRLEILPALDATEVFEPFLRAQLQADFLISNPPYLLPTPEEVDFDVLTHEPIEALFSPTSDPLYFYQKIALEASKVLKPNGYVFLEMPHQRSLEIQTFFQQQGWTADILPDLTNRDRVLIAQKR